MHHSWLDVIQMNIHTRSYFFFSSRRRHTRFDCDWSSDVCSSDLEPGEVVGVEEEGGLREVAVLVQVAVEDQVVVKLRLLFRGEADHGDEVGGEEIGRASCRERV